MNYPLISSMDLRANKNYALKLIVFKEEKDREKELIEIMRIE